MVVGKIKSVTEMWMYSIIKSALHQYEIFTIDELIGSAQGH